MITATDVYKITSEEVNKDWFFSISSKRNGDQKVEGSERKFHFFLQNVAKLCHPLREDKVLRFMPEMFMG